MTVPSHLLSSQNPRIRRPEREREWGEIFEGRESEMDKNAFGDLENLPEEDKIRMAAMIDQLQIRDRYCTFSTISMLRLIFV